MRRPPAALLLLLGLALGVGRPAAAQAPLTLVDERTQVRSIGFKFTDTQTFEPAALKEQIALTEQEGLFGSVGLRKRLAFLPFVSDLEPRPFVPIELARDAVRIERFYAQNGFLQADADWLPRLDSAANVVHVLFVVTEGPPLLLTDLAYVGPGGAPVAEQLPAELQEGWARFKERAEVQTGQRLDAFKLIQLEDQARSWARDRGFAFAEVGAESTVDSLANRAAVRVVMDVGPRARVGRIEVEGAESVSERIVRRELPFREGDLFSQGELVEGQREVFGLSLFQIALADVPEGQPEDSTVAVRIRVREGDPRLLSAQVGYLSEAGATATAQWTHRNFFGGARTFTAGAIANTGVASFASQPERRYRGSVSLRQPYFFDRRLAASTSVFAEQRDDRIEQSQSVGGELALLFERSQLRTASVRYSTQLRRVSDFRSTSLFSSVFDLFGAALEDSVGTNLNRSLLGLDLTYGSTDRPLDPRRGFVLRPTAEVTVPFPTTRVEYGRLGGSASLFLPFTERVGLFGRVSGGHLAPFGKSLPSGGVEDVAAEYLRLRNAAYYAGGTTDVRGWGQSLVGPKLPDFSESTVVDEMTGDTTVVATPLDRYVPFGGYSKVAATLEARLPFPGLSETFGTFAFLDAGRLWVDDRYDDFLTAGPDSATVLTEDFAESRTRLYFGAGGGIEIATPVGALRLAVGYKLNPSPFDVRRADDVGCALLGRDTTDATCFMTDDAGNPDFDRPLYESLGDVPTRPWQRLHIHFQIGQTF